MLLLALMAGGGMLFLKGLRSLDEPVSVRSAFIFTVQPKSSFARVANELAAQGVIAQPRAWVLYARFKGLASAVKAGEYRIEPGITPRELLSKMVSGQVLLHCLHHRRWLEGFRFARCVAPSPGREGRACRRGRWRRSDRKSWNN